MRVQWHLVRQKRSIENHKKSLSVLGVVSLASSRNGVRSPDHPVMAIQVEPIPLAAFRNPSCTLQVTL